MLGSEKMGDNNLVIYHGSTEIIKEPTYGRGNPLCDYGLGFYCTEDKSAGKLWSVNKDTSGYNNKYELDISDFKILNLDDDKTLEWLAILLSYRIPNNLTSIDDDIRTKFISRYYNFDLSKYDIITGYRADDSYFKIATEFLRGTLKYEILNEALHLGKLGKQVVLKSERAFDKVKFIEYEIVENSQYYDKYKNSDKQARNMFNDLLGRSRYLRNGRTIVDFI
ncbi:DUF3990 domain-containing protein [Clostridium botulinum]|nr:DUF3990 domain-containing protein [Clostridium botulinum]